MQICLIIFLLHYSAFHILPFYSLDFHWLVLTDFALIGFYDSPCRFKFYLQPGTLPSERLSPYKKTVLLIFYRNTVAPGGSDQNTQRLLCYMNTFLSSERFQAALQWAASRGKEEQRGEKEGFSLLLTSFLFQDFLSLWFAKRNLKRNRTQGTWFSAWIYVFESGIKSYSAICLP